MAALGSMTAITASVTAVSSIGPIVMPMMSPVGVDAATVTPLIEPRGGVATMPVLPQECNCERYGASNNERVTNATQIAVERAADQRRDDSGAKQYEGSNAKPSHGDHPLNFERPPPTARNHSRIRDPSEDCWKERRRRCSTCLWSSARPTVPGLWREGRPA